MKQQRGLGRGLEALFSSDAVETKITPMSDLTEIEISKIAANPSQPRSTFDDEQLSSLADSIRELGLIQPITVKREGAERYTIISGERRWRASQMAGLTTIPVYIREADDEALHVMALVENLQREDLNPIEIALGLRRLIDECHLTQDQLSTRVSIKRSSISNYLRLLKLSDEVQFALKSGVITMGHAKAIASVESADGRLELLKVCIERAISVREAEALAQKMNTTVQSPKQPKSKAIPKGYEGVASHLEGIFSGGVEIRSNRRGGGRIVINFSNRDEVMQLIEGLSKED